MNRFDTIYKSNVLNIFTDASICAEKYNGYTVGCAGVELATSSSYRYNMDFNNYIPNYAVILDTTNNNSELIAIRQGILFAIANQKYFDEINLFSDSLISINGLTQWIEGWFFKALKDTTNKDNILMSSSGSPVANQDIIKNIVALIYYNKLKINFFHQRGHCLDNLPVVRKDFIKSNNIKENVSDLFVSQIATINDIVDKRSRDIMRTFIKTGYAPYIINNTIDKGITYDISKIYFKGYKGLIGK